jgi:hypothetical protein
VVAPFTGGQALFAPSLTRETITVRYNSGAQIITRPADGAIQPGTDPLFLISPHGTLSPATPAGALASVPGGTLVLLGPAPDPE